PELLVGQEIDIVAEADERANLQAGPERLGEAHVDGLAYWPGDQKQQQECGWRIEEPGSLPVAAQRHLEALANGARGASDGDGGRVSSHFGCQVPWKLSQIFWILSCPA